MQSKRSIDGDCYIGTSGWSYPHWRTVFYPDTLPGSAYLDYYARHFSSVEINHSFYQLPSTTTIEHWCAQVPTQFLFAVKASRFITHMKKLRDPDQTLPPFFQSITPLKHHLGPILFQLPPRWHCNLARLEQFLASLSPDYRYAFEFRDRSWIAAPVLAALRRANAAFCIYDLNGYQSPAHVTADFVYLRLHGPDGPYQGSYSSQVLHSWADRIANWRGQRHKVFCYFDNDTQGFAVDNALALQAMLKH